MTHFIILSSKWLSTSRRPENCNLIFFAQNSEIVAVTVNGRCWFGSEIGPVIHIAGLDSFEYGVWIASFGPLSVFLRSSEVVVVILEHEDSWLPLVRCMQGSRWPLFACLDRIHHMLHWNEYSPTQFYHFLKLAFGHLWKCLSNKSSSSFHTNKSSYLDSPVTYFTKVL